ncbi:MAG: methyltransferase domain-containing protein [Candidatus Nealsonbacteria bacterium]|nr:methyltransferase domain-containing protein [Candidatus Nealsonbacteria bacterium]
MKVPEYVTNIKLRKSEWPERHIDLPYDLPPQGFFSPEYQNWLKENRWMIDFSVHVSDFALAKEIAGKIWIAHKQGKQEEVKLLLEELQPLRVIPFDKRTALKKWVHMMVQMPGDIGGPNKKKICEVLSKRCKGRVLEAMCGFNSYIEPSDSCEVTALDYCREALERYRYPERKRIIFDLNEVGNNGGMEFFKDGEFDAITICFGFQYLENPAVVFKEFNRILKGKLILVENPRQHYEDIACRPFTPKICTDFLKQASFKKINVEDLNVAEKWELEQGGHYFLIEALKS